LIQRAGGIVRSGTRVSGHLRRESGRAICSCI
jgi:hypothetical protein